MANALPPAFKPFTGPVSALVDIFVRMPKTMPKSKRDGARPTTKPDVDNFAKTVMDAAEGLIYLRDSQVILLRAQKHYAPPDESPRWSLVFKEMSG
jgi:Holliday junction resolvase RusA-like endonuclease